jgi:3',5'-nucleoside bisphosphate phosphatase
MIDLHMHSTFSDGSLTPVSLVEEAVRLGLTAIALTDHDTIDGVHPLLRAARGWPGLRVIPAVELDSDYTGGAMHFLGYGVNPFSDVLREHLTWLRGGGRARCDEILVRLSALGIRITWRELTEITPQGEPGRMEIAEMIRRRGHARTKEEAFSKFLTRGKPAYAPKRKLSPFGCIDLIREAGGVPVLAHPFTLKLNARQLRPILADLSAHGLGGLEVYYSEANPQWEQSFGELARACKLVPTGGSDFHGALTPDVKLGVGAGSLHVPDSLLDPLVEAIRQQKGHWLP